MKLRKVIYRFQLAALVLVGTTGIIGSLIGNIDKIKPGFLKDVGIDYGAVSIFMLSIINIIAIHFPNQVSQNRARLQ